MENANLVGMPLDPNIKLVVNHDGNKLNWSNSYARLLGELQFITNSTRPDISFAVNRLRVFMANPSLQHHGVLKRVLRYLADMRTLRITYCKSKDENHIKCLFYGFTDVSHASKEDMKSIVGYVFLVGGGAVTWKLKKQMIIALSMTKADCIALAKAGYKTA
jgi:hypothetical protein